MTQQTTSFPRRVFDSIGKELALVVAVAGILTLWRLPLALLMPIALVWLMTFTSLGFLHQVQEARPRGASIAVTLLLSSAFLVTAVSLVVGLFRSPDAVKKIEDEITHAIKDMKTAQAHSINCKDCPALWKDGNSAVLLTSALISAERKTIPLAPFVVAVSSSPTVVVAFWALAALYFLVSVFIGIGAIIAGLGVKVLSHPQQVAAPPPKARTGKR